MAKGKKKLDKIIKLQLPAGKATPAPPIGPALGAAQVNIPAFCKEFNARTEDRLGEVVPVEIFVYSDKSFEFVTKQPPVSRLLLKELGVGKGSSVPNRNHIGQITEEQVVKIAERKMPDLRVNSVVAAVQTVAGTARSMGIQIIGKKDETQK